VTIAHLMLKNNEPYRYAQPERVRAKLRHVERAAEAAGLAAAPAARPEPVTEPPDRLNRTLTRTGLPAAQGPAEWSAGERRALEAAGVRGFAEAVHAPPPKRGPKPKAVKA
jgi:hypothetical protein